MSNAVGGVGVFCSRVVRMFVFASMVLCLTGRALAVSSLLANVPEAVDYDTVYELEIPDTASWNANPIPYAIENTSSIVDGSFDRVAYYLELISGTVTQWVYVSMDTFATNATMLGVPNTGSGEYYHYGITGPITNGVVLSNVGGITTGEGINTINLEFWPSNYGGGNDYGVPGANGSTFDFGDGGSGTGSGYGSMQIHNYAAGEVLFAYNHWGTANGEVGIGNQPTGNPDWTFSNVLGTYSKRTLLVLVHVRDFAWYRPGVSDITMTSAKAHATLDVVGASDALAWLYWDTSDRGRDAAAWANTNTLGSVSTGFVGNVALSGLSPDTTYTYRFFGTNSVTTNGGWSYARNFRTQALGEWNGAENDVWGNANNWTGGNVPDNPAESALFGGHGAGEVDLDGTGYTVHDATFVGGDYTLTNSGGAAALVVAALVNDSGANTIAVGMSVTGETEVSGGTLTLDSVGDFDTGALTLSGGTLVVDGATVERTHTMNVLLHKGYHGHSDDTYMDLDGNGGLMTLTPYGAAPLTAGPSGRGLDFDSDADFRADGAVGQNDYYANLFIGYFHPPMTGIYGFRNAGDDDRAGIWIDLDRDGVFESSTPGRGSNRGEQLSWEDGGNKQVTLTGGLSYMIAFTHREHTSSSRCDFRFSLPSEVEQVVKPSNPAQDGLWSVQGGSVDASGLPGMTVTDDSGLAVAGAGRDQEFAKGAVFGDVELASGTLSISADAGAAVRFGGFAGTGNVAFSENTIAVDSPSSMGTLFGRGGGAVTGATLVADILFDLEPTVAVYSQLDGPAELHAGDLDATDGVVALYGTNTYTGLTRINRATLRADDGVGLPSDSALVFYQNNRDQTCVLETKGTFSRNIGTGAGEVFWENRGGGGGFAARGGDLVVNLSGGSFLTWNSAWMGFNSVDSLQFGSRSADSMVEFMNGLALDSATRRIQLVDNPSVKTDTVRFSGMIVGGGSGALLRFYETAGNEFNSGVDGGVLVELLGRNSYVHKTMIEECALYAIEGVGLPVNSTLRFDGNGGNREAIFLSFGEFVREIGNGDGEVRWDAEGGGFAARGGKFTVTLEGGVQLDWGNADTGFNGRRLMLNSKYADDVVEIVNDIDLNDQARRIYVFDNLDTKADVAVLSGNLTGTRNADLRFYKDGLGVLWLRGSNDWGQPLQLDNGVVRIDGPANLSPNTTVIFEQGNRALPGVLEAKGSITDWSIGRIDEVKAFCWDAQHGGFAAYGGPLTVNLENNVVMDAGSIDTGFDGHALQLGSYTANDVVDFQNDMWLSNRTHRFEVFENADTDADRSIYSGDITFTGWGDVEVGGDGVLEMTGATSTRNTRVYETGTLLFEGVHINTDQVYTENNQSGRIGGTGLVRVQNRFDIRASGTLGPGARGAGTLNVSVPGANGFRMYDLSTYEWELGASAADLVAVNGNLELREGWTLRLLSAGGTPREDEEYDIFTYTGDLLYHPPVVDVSGVPDEWDTSGLRVAYDYAGRRVYVTGIYSTLSVANEAVSDLTSTSARLNGTLSCSGAVMNAWVYWGATDGGMDEGAWDNRSLVGTYSDVVDTSLSIVASGLETNALVYYTFRATNATEDLWAAVSESFMTLGPPLVDNDGGATGIRGRGTAELHGTFNDHNRGAVTICWGLTDGGTNSIADWDHVDSIGSQTEVSFSGGVSGVYYPQTYFYRCFASNGYGVGWASTAATFTVTARPVVPDGDGLRVRGYDAENSAINLDPITNLFLKTASGMGVQTDDINYNSAAGAWYTTFSHIGITDPNYWSLLFDGVFVADESTTYTFGLDNDDGCVLYLDLNGDGDFADANELVVNDNWGQGVGTVHTEEIALAKGVYCIAIGWYQGAGGYGVIAKWGKGSGLAWGDLDFIDGASDAFYLGMSGDGVAIANAQATDRSMNTATINATIDITNAVYDVWAYWGTADGETNAVNWASNAFVGTYTNVAGLAVSHAIDGLNASSTDFYTFQLSNALEQVWAVPSTNVLPITVPVIDNDAGGTAVEVGVATLRGALTAGHVADVYVYWGRSDGGTTPGSWDNCVLLADTPEGAFSVDVAAGHGFPYHYRCLASNAMGYAWADGTASFTMPQPDTWEYVYAEGLRGSIFTGTPNNDTRLNLGGSSYGISYTRIFTGAKAGTVLQEAEDPSNNAVATGEISAWNNFPNFDGNLDSFVTAFSGRIVPRTTGSHTFRFNSDDRSWMWIDIDDNGVFETGEEVGTYAWTCTGSKTLTQGKGYNFVAMSQEYGGGQSVNWYVTEPGLPEAVVSTVNQAPLWQYATGVRDLLGLANGTESDVSTNAATLNGTLVGPGRVFDVWVHWGETDGGTNAGVWENNVFVGAYTNHEGAVSCALSGLSGQTDYFYTFQATNSATNLWATPSEPLQTLGGSVVISNNAAVNVGQAEATLSGELVAGGSGDGTIYWGLSDGGASHTAWANTNGVGIVDVGTFTNTVTVLAGGTYYYRCYVTNTLGDGWAPSTEIFTTPQAGVRLSIAIVREDIESSPLEVSGCALWLDGSDIDGDGSTDDNPEQGAPVDVWYDKSGHARDATREGFDQTSYNRDGPNGKGVVTFNEDYLSTSYNFDSLVEYTVLSVARYTGGDNQRVISSATRNWIFGFHNGGDERLYAEGWIHNTGTANTNWHVHAGHINSATDPEASFWKDGAKLVTGGTGSGAANYMIGRLGLGGYRNGNEESACEIAEVLIYDRVLTENELEQIGFYLGWKYGVNTAYADSYPVVVTERYGGFNVTASLSAPAISNVTVNFDFVTNLYGYVEGMRGSVFLKEIYDDNAINLDGANYEFSDRRVFTGDKAGTVLVLDEDLANNVIATGEVLNWNQFPSFDGNADSFATVFSGTIIPRMTGAHSFRGSCDDHSWMYIDMADDGVWDGSDRVYTGDTSGSKDLVQGLPYNFIFMHREGGGGQNINWYVTEPGNGEERVSTTAQPGMWSHRVPLAGGGSDYVPSATTVVIRAGSVSTNIFLTVVDDLEQEDDEAVAVGILSVVNATNAQRVAVSGTLSSRDPKVDHGDGATDVTGSSATLNGVLAIGDDADVTLYWGTSDGGTNHASWGTTVVVGVVMEDWPFLTDVTGLSAGEVYYYRCFATNSSNLAEDWADATASFTTTAAKVSIDDVAIVEGNAGRVDAVFTLSSSATGLTAISVGYSTLDGTASAGADYVAASGRIELPVGVMHTQVAVSVTGDIHFEFPHEQFTLNLSNPTNCTIGKGVGTATIVDDDAATELLHWPNRLKITVTGYGGSETLTSFPVLVRFSESIRGFEYRSFASAVAGDLRFCNAAGTTLLNHEIEQWNSNGVSFVWVQVPELPPGGAWFWARWGNAQETTPPPYTSDGSTWSEGHLAVWHLAEENGIGSITAPDSANGNDGTLQNMNPAANWMPGVIANALNFDTGNDNRQINVGSLGQDCDETTVSFWTKPSGGGERSIFHTKQWVAGDLHYFLMDSDQIRFAVNGVVFGTGGNTFDSVSTLPDDVWTHWAAVYSVGEHTARMYKNGVPDAIGPFTGSESILYSHGIYIGANNAGTGREMNGLIDELRIEEVVRSADWIKACYDNQAQGSTFVGYSDLFMHKGMLLIIR